MKYLSNAQIALYERATRGYRRLTGKNLAVSTVMGLLTDVDPTPQGKYQRWLCERLTDNSARNEPGLWDIDGGHKSQVSRTLRSFHLTKRLLAEDQRNILNYKGLREVEQIIQELDKSRFICHRGMLATMNMDTVYHATLIEQASDISVHAPRNIEEAAMLLNNDRLLDARGEGLYRDLLSDGDIRIFISSGHVLIGALPSPGSRSIVFDSMGEHAVFEDMLAEIGGFETINWGSDQSVLKVMIQIDPTLPFDIGMEEAEPYQVALLQFPHVLFEDREIPDHLRDSILADSKVREAIMGFE